MTELTIKQNEKMEKMVKDFNCSFFKKGRVYIQNIDYILTCGYKMKSGEYKVIAEYKLMNQPVYFDIGLTKRENTRVKNIFEIACYKLLQYIASTCKDDEEDDE